MTNPENFIYLTSDILKKQAKALKEYLNNDREISLSSCYNALASIYGFKNWNALSAFIKNSEK